jgi:cytochrome c-type biogenesis protein CcmE
MLRPGFPSFGARSRSMDHATPSPDLSFHRVAPAKKRSAWAPIGVAVVVVGIVLYVVGTSTSGGAGMYSYTLQQVAEQGRQLEGREIKVTGKVAAGSVRGAPASKEFRFDLDDGQGHRLPIAYARLLPDPFQEGREAIVQGKVENGTLFASNLTVKCPSRYADGNDKVSDAEQQKYYEGKYKEHKAAQPQAAP